MPSCEAVARVSLRQRTGSYATATGQIDGTGNESEATAVVEIDGSAVESSQPRLSSSVAKVQEAGIEVYVGGVQVSPDVLTAGVSVTRNRRENIQGATLGVALAEWGTSPLGDGIAKLAAPTGKSEIDIYGCYRDQTTGTVYRFPLLLRGIADSASRESSPTAGHTEPLQISDAGARIAQQSVTFTLPPGHGLPRGRIVRKFLAAAGETEFALEDGGKCYQERQFVDANPITQAQEILDVEGRVLRWDRHGKAVCPQLWKGTYNPIATISEDDILAISVCKLDLPANVITEVIATGTEQVLKEDDLCGEVSVSSRVETSKTFAVFRATREQQSDGTLSAPYDENVAAFQLFSLVITRQTTRCGVVTREESETWQFFNPETFRYVWDSLGVEWDASGAGVADLRSPFVDGSATVGGSEPAYLYLDAKWTLFSKSVTNYYYDSPGYDRPWNSNDFNIDRFLWGNDLSFEGTIESDGSGGTGKFLGSVSDSYGYYAPRVAIYQRGDTDVAFAESDLINGVKRFGGGDGVGNLDYVPWESFIKTARVVNTTVANDAGYIEKEGEFTYGWKVAGVGSGEYQFGDGTISDVNAESLQILNQVTKTYTRPAGTENRHTETSVTIPFGESATVVNKPNQEGAGPTVEYLPGYEPYDPNQHLDDEEQTFAEHAQLGETRPIKVDISAPELLTNHLARIVKTSYPYAENLNELSNAATNVIRESLIISVTLTLAANFLLAEDDCINLTHHPVGAVNRNVIIDSITYEAEPSGQCLTHLTLDLYTDG